MSNQAFKVETYAQSMTHRHHPARPMEIVKDREGDLWLCDKGVDPGRDLREQECWNCGELPFNRND